MEKIMRIANLFYVFLLGVACLFRFGLISMPIRHVYILIVSVAILFIFTMTLAQYRDKTIVQSKIDREYFSFFCGSIMVPLLAMVLLFL